MRPPPSVLMAGAVGPVPLPGPFSRIEQPMVARVLSTPAADALIARLGAMHGPLMFHQSGGCCDGSSPMCYPRGEFKVGGQDVLLGEIAGGCPVYIGAAQ